MRRLAAAAGAVAVVVMLAGPPGRSAAAPGASRRRRSRRRAASACSRSRMPVHRCQTMSGRCSLRPVPAMLAIQRAAVRALGRLERRDVITDCCRISQALIRRSRTRPPWRCRWRCAARHSRACLRTIRLVGDSRRAGGLVARRRCVPRAAGRLPYTTAEQVRSGRGAARRRDQIRPDDRRSAPLRGLEALARLQPQVAALRGRHAGPACARWPSPTNDATLAGSAPQRRWPRSSPRRRWTRRP